jgi:hypothetical protein
MKWIFKDEISIGFGLELVGLKFVSECGGQHDRSTLS